MIPAAPATAACHATAEGTMACPQCGKDALGLYGYAWSNEPMKCAQCYDDWYFADKPPEVREHAEKQRAVVLAWMITGNSPNDIRPE